MMNTEPDMTQISFHEATLTGIVRRGSAVSLSLEGVFVSGVQRAAEVTVEGVDAMLRDGVLIADLHMEKEDGEILRARPGTTAMIDRENNLAFPVG